MENILKLKKELCTLADKKQAQVLQGFFKTGKGQYGEGDIFLGVKVPIQRQVAKKYFSLTFQDLETLLQSEIHEYRLCSLFVLIAQFEKADEKRQKEIFKFYLKNAKRINNWDLVDLSAPNIVGKYLSGKKALERKVLYKLAVSHNLWERRIAVLATFEFIRQGESKDIFAIAKTLLKDEHDLIHKAVGWMLREVGKRISEGEEEKFLKKYYRQMPRTMLRYAIERFSEEKRKRYLRGKM